jgi:hypothetical protein
MDRPNGARRRFTSERIGNVIELIRMGYWHSDREPHLPHPDRFVDRGWDPDERRLTADYLSGGYPILHMMGYSPCRMCSLEANGASELTDGTFLWPEGLVHYITEHGVRLPSAFVEHAVGRFMELDEAAVRAHQEPLEHWIRMTR